MPSKTTENKTRRYRLAVIDNNTLKPLWTCVTSRNRLFITVITILTLLFAITFAIIAFTPLRTFLPGFPYGKARTEVIQTAMTIDSLENVIKKWSFYSENLKRVVEGEPTIPIDSIIRNPASTPLGKNGLEQLKKQDSTLRNKVNEEEKFALNVNKERSLPIEGKHFFTPLHGVVSRGFNQDIHPFIDITAPANSVVMAALDGTVIHASWSDDFGYTIEIQHPDDIITIYKHNQKLMKATGDKVQAGTPIALVGNTSSLMTGDHLHFELWYKGEPVDPTRFIKF